MDTTRNRAAVLAKFLRNATRDLRAIAKRVDDEADLARTATIASIDAVAEELELVAAAPPRPLPDAVPDLPREDRRQLRDELPPDLPRETMKAAPARSSHDEYYAHRLANMHAPDPAGGMR